MQQEPSTAETKQSAAWTRQLDDAAFIALFDQLLGPVTRYLYRMTGSRETADDLAQETFLKAYQAFGRNEPERNPRAWIFRIATNVAISHHRRQRLIRWLPFVSGAAEPADDSLADTVGARVEIAATLRRIGPRHASVLILRHQLDLPIDEVAQSLGVSPNTAKVRLFRARKAFIDAWRAREPAPRNPTLDAEEDHQ
jgi:RNA polymerase sigma-70 factor (ECF subfamily)